MARPCSISSPSLSNRRHTSPVSPRPPPPQRIPSRSPSESDDSASSPERTIDDDTDFFMAQANDSQSSLGVTNLREMSMSIDLEQQHRLSPISRLPPELLISIFAKLNSTADLRSCMLVSYNWAIHCVGVLWHRPQCNIWKNLINVTASLSKNPLFPYHEMVRRLNLATLHDKVNDGTIQPFMQCKRIERLTLTNCSKLTDSGVSGLVEGNKHLQALDVTDIRSLTDHTLLTVATHCPRLQGLNVTNCSKITDESLVAVAENCRQIKRVGNHPSFRIESLLTHTQLKLNNLPLLTDESITAFAENCSSILEIDLHSCSQITSESVTALLRCLYHLRELRLAHCTGISDSAFLNLPPKMNFDYLRILDLTGCEEVRDDAICRIIPATPKLRNLVLAKCRHITDRAVAAICRLGKNLHYIHLGHCINLTDNAVIALVKSCNRIRYIDLACCNRLTDNSVQHLAQLPKLRRIGLVKCQQLTDASILALARGSMAGGRDVRPGCLERVHLSYCVSLTLQVRYKHPLGRSHLAYFRAGNPRASAILPTTHSLVLDWCASILERRSNAFLSRSASRVHASSERCLLCLFRRRCLETERISQTISRRSREGRTNL
jgi:F-box and leucine-rich repeat protein GRR1